MSSVSILDKAARFAMVDNKQCGGAILLLHFFQFLDLHDPDADNFQSFVASSLSKDTYSIKFS